MSVFPVGVGVLFVGEDHGTLGKSIGHLKGECPSTQVGMDVVDGQRLGG